MNNLRYLALALLLTTNVVVAEETVKEISNVEVEVIEPVKAEDTPKEDFVDKVDAAYVALKHRTKEVIDWAKGSAVKEENKEVRHTELRKDLEEAKDDFFTGAHVSKTAALVKAQERTVKTITEKRDGAVLSKNEKSIEQLNKELTDAKEALKETESAAKEAQSTRAAFEARAAARVVDDAKKALGAHEKALVRTEKRLASLKNVVEPSAVVKAEIKAVADKVVSQKEAVKEAKEAFKVAEKAVKEANKKADIKVGSSSTGLFAGVSSFVTAHPVAVAVGGTAVTVVAVYALYKWNNAEHRVATLEEELAELEMTNVNA